MSIRHTVCVSLSVSKATMRNDSLPVLNNVCFLDSWRWTVSRAPCAWFGLGSHSWVRCKIGGTLQILRTFFSFYGMQFSFSLTVAHCNPLSSKHTEQWPVEMFTFYFFGWNLNKLQWALKCSWSKMISFEIRAPGSVYGIRRMKLN